MSTHTITPERLHELARSGEPIDLIDVRTPAEFREVHALPARNLPLDRLDVRGLAAERASQSRPLYVICRSGARAQQACDKLQAAGLNQVVNVEGGTLAWDQAGLPVARGKKTLPLDRQARIAAGLIVLTGVALSRLVHPGWIGLSAFVGVGLIFAGVTGWCGMAMLLARMPWNRVALDAPGPASASSPPAGKSCCN